MVVESPRTGDSAELIEEPAHRLHVLVDGLAFHPVRNDRDADWALATIRAELAAIAEATR